MDRLEPKILGWQMGRSRAVSYLGDGVRCQADGADLKPRVRTTDLFKAISTLTASLNMVSLSARVRSRCWKPPNLRCVFQAVLSDEVDFRSADSRSVLQLQGQV